MAGCYHDIQDFKSDLNIEVARECDILEAGQDLKDRKCTKNPGHRGFIPFKDLTLEHLPIEHRNREILDNVKTMGSRVVRLVVNNKKRGSGCVVKLELELDNDFFIMTNNHVVQSKDEVQHCTVEFHYDDDSRSSVESSRGVNLIDTCPYRDITIFSFHPVPDFVYQQDWMETKSSIIMMLINNQTVTGITFLYILQNTPKLQLVSTYDLNSQVIDLMFILHEDSISYLKSSYFQFQPIPSSIQELTSIEIHIDEDDGNSRVISGDVVKFGDEFVVEISESIFQDEVKKCRLVWNGEVIGRGTRLYFKQLKPSDIRSGIDLELFMEDGEEKYWTCEFHPIPKHILQETNSSSDMCCIGHPHSGIKMVTFGHALTRTEERFDNLGRHIAKPGTDCKCKEVGCVTYTCKTCPGSSGSPVFQLKRRELAFPRFHFMGSVGYLNGKPITNLNAAWCQYTN